MAITTSTSPGISQRTNVYAAREMLKHAAPVVVLDKLGMSKTLPQNKSSTMKFRRPKTFTEATTPLAEGVTPSIKPFMFEDVSVTLSQYGEVYGITDVIEDVHEDPVLKEISRQAGENIGRTMEALNYAVLKAGTNVFYANGSARSDVNTAITLSKQRAVVRALKAQKGEKITQIVDGSTKVATRAVQASFVAVAHTDMEHDIKNLPDFVPVSQYGNRTTISEYECGSVDDVRYILSPDLGPFEDAGGAKGSMESTSGTSADVYPILYFAREAFATVTLRGFGSVEPSIIPVGQKTKDDPLAQRGYVGWKTWHACVILNDNWMARLECAATAL